MRRAGLVMALCLVLAGCVGTVTREEFDAEVRVRGGGFEQAAVRAALDRVATEVGTPRFDITTLDVWPGPTRVSLRVRDPRAPDQLDDYEFRDGDLEEVEPVRVTADVDVAGSSIPVDAFAIDRLDRVVDEALAAYGTEGAYVVHLQLAPVLPHPEQAGGPPGRITVDMESPRSAATATFTADGVLETVVHR